MFWDNFFQIFYLTTYGINLLLVFTGSFMLISQKQDPVKTLSWILVMFLLPYFGVFMYFFIGRNFRKEKMFSRKGAADLKIRQSYANRMISEIVEGKKLPEELIKHERLIVQNLKTSNSLLTLNKDVEIYFSGKSSLESMLSAIQNSKQHVHIQSFIIEDDEIGKRLKDLLIEKVSQKVEVRLIIDGFGGRGLVGKYLNELKSAGVEVLIFSPFRWLFPPLFSNYRNHRKILIVDGKVGFLGGVNIADRYYDGGEFEEWRDTHMRIEGEAIVSLQASFLLDRYFILHKNVRPRRKYYPDINLIGEKVSGEKQIYSQIISSGPDSDWSSIMQCYFSAITKAKKHIYINTPYFTPSSPILDAVKITALSNVEVNLMIPERSDTKLAHWCTMSYISELLRAGVKIYLFKKGFNHSKVISIDGEYCIVGSANMDNRSFEHNFEITSVLYDKESAKLIEDRFIADISRCTLVSKQKWDKRPWKNRVYESFARLVSPMV